MTTTLQAEKENTEINNVEKKQILLKENFLKKIKDFFQHSGYTRLNTPYFNSLRHKLLYYRPLYFNATPEERICIIDIIVIHPTLQSRNKIITELELLNRDCQQIRQILLSEYSNCARVFDDRNFKPYEYDFVWLPLFKKNKNIPTYNNSWQMLFSVKPLVITFKDQPETDFQRDSRVDIIPYTHLPTYLPEWYKEIEELGKDIYNPKKYNHYDIQEKFDNIALLFGILWLIPTELNIFLQWSLWFFSFEFFIFLVIMILLSWPIHSYIRYKKFCNICKEEIVSSKWIAQCNYLKPFSVRSSQLLVRPLEQVKEAPYQSSNSEQKNLEFFAAPQIEGRNASIPPTEIFHRSSTSQNITLNQNISQLTPVSTSHPEPRPSTTLPPKPSGRGVRHLLKPKTKDDFKINVFKQQIGDLYSKLKIVSNIDQFKNYTLRIIMLILVCEWVRLTGKPPINVRIKEVSNVEVDYYRQIEDILRKFLDKKPDALDVEEIHRLATIINMGHLNQKTIEHVEWKIEDWLLKFELLTDDKMKILMATHSMKTNLAENTDLNIKELPHLSTPPPQTQDSPPPTPPSSEEEPPPSIPQQQVQAPQSQERLKTIIRMERVDTSKIITDNDGPIESIPALTEEEKPNKFRGDLIESYERFKFITEDTGYEAHKIPVCLLAFNSKDHPQKIIQEFIEITHQMPEIVDYAIFDFGTINPEISEGKNFQPLQDPTIWVRDKKFNIHDEFKYSTSKLACYLADLRTRIKDGNAPSPIPPEDTSQDEEQHFEQLDSDSPDLAVEEAIQIEQDIDSDLPENLQKTAEIFEVKERDINLDEALTELEQWEAGLEPSSPSEPQQQEEEITVVDEPEISLESDQKVVVTHSRSLNSRYIFQPSNIRGNGIVIDTNNFIHSFWDDIEQSNREYQWTPDYYLMEVLDRLYQTLTALGYGPIVFYGDPDFFIYLLPQPEKSRKIKNFGAKKRNYLRYQATREEYNFYEHNLRGKLLIQVEKKLDTDAILLNHAKTHEYKIISNDEFNKSKYDQFREYIAKHKYTFEVRKTNLTIYDENKSPICNPIPLMDLPDELNKKIVKMVEIKSSLPTLSKVESIDSSYKLDSSVLEIVYGVFHSIKGPTLLFPTCKACENELQTNRIAILGAQEFNLDDLFSITDCNCPLPITNIPRTEVKKHLTDVLSSDGFRNFSNGHTYLGWRWLRKEAKAARQELVWAIIIYLDRKNPIYEWETEIIKEFIKDYELNIDDEIMNLIDMGLEGDELDKKFYELLYDHLIKLSLKLTTYIHDKIHDTKR